MELECQELSAQVSRKETCGVRGQRKAQNGR